MGQAKKGKWLLLCACIACVIALAGVLVGCGSGASEPIVGQWKLSGISSTQTDGVRNFNNGSATVTADGKITADVASELKMTGTWEAVPKSKWVATEVEGTIGEYTVSLKTETGGYTNFYAFVSKNDSGYHMFLLLEADTSVSLVFDR